MTAKKVLLEIAQELREHPERWTQHTMARNAGGMSTFSKSPDAVCWCLMGHLRKRGQKDGLGMSPEAIEACDLLNEEIGGIPAWNDNYYRTVQDVIALCERMAA